MFHLIGLAVLAESAVCTHWTVPRASTS